MNPSETVNVSRIAAAIARELTPAGSPPAVIQVGDAEALAIGGSVDIVIIVSGTTYTLTVTAPTEAKNEWAFALTMKPAGGDASTIAAFSFNPTTKAWSVAVGLPRIQVSENFIIETVQIKLQST
jgi:hypothetical protein